MVESLNQLFEGCYPNEDPEAEPVLAAVTELRADWKFYKETRIVVPVSSLCTTMATHKLKLNPRPYIKTMRPELFSFEICYLGMDGVQENRMEQQQCVPPLPRPTTVIL